MAVALAFAFTPQFDYNDWMRNTEGLQRGLRIYDNPDTVYLPWDLVLLWPYYLLTAAGARVASVLVVGWLTIRCHWPLMYFLAVLSSPYFIWTMLISNIDVLALLLPVVLWESVKGTRWQTAGWTVAIALLLIKPQGSFLLIAYWIWSCRRNWRELFWPLAVAGLLVVSTSLIGQPPLLLQWLDNVQNPSADNRLFWSINNVSLSETLGLLPAVAVVSAALIGVRLLLQRRGFWTKNHTYASLLLAAMLLSPYASSQGVIAPLAFLPSASGVVIQYVLIFGAAALGLYSGPYDAWWALLLGVILLYLYRSPDTIDHSPTPENLNATDDKTVSLPG